MEKSLSIDKTYSDLVRDILENGSKKSDRTGTGTISVFGKQIFHDMRDGFPLLTTKKMAWKQIVTELLWFLSGSTNIRFLLENNCHIWDGDAYKRYRNTPREMMEDEDLAIVSASHAYTDYFELKDETGELMDFVTKIKTDDRFAQKWGDLGPIYGKQWKKWRGINGEIDQISNLINDLRSNPDSRRLMVNAWNVAEIGDMILPPCHYGFQLYTRELSLEERSRIQFDESYEQGMSFRVADSHEDLESNPEKFPVPPRRAISLMWNQRSVDVGLGLPFNIASYALLLLLIADEVQMQPEMLIGNFGDCHIYTNHVDKLREQIKRQPFSPPSVSVQDGIFSVMPSDILLENYRSHPAVKLQLSN